MEFSFEAKLWIWAAEKAAWHFISVPKEYYETLKDFATPQARGFGSIKVEATIGDSTWKTSIFPDSKEKVFLLPVKKSVRKAENINENDSVQVSLNLIDL